jgi:rRNA small subunit aminocarboxypropyltransferase
MKIQVLMFEQDDPVKCTAAKLVKFGIAKRVRHLSGNDMILNPFAKEFVLRSDRDLIKAITAIDCSWELAQNMFLKKFEGVSRKLPPLLAGNPVNYSKIGKLTTAEAIAGALYIMGYSDLAESIINKFKWGHTFFDLNQYLLEDYSLAKTIDDVVTILQEYGIK